MVLVDKSKITFFDYLFLFVAIIVAGRASIFARDFGSLTSTCTYLMLGFSLISFFRHKPDKNKTYIKILAFAFGYITLLFITNQFFAIGNYTIWFIKITVFYALYNCFKDKFLLTYETILFHLCIIAIVLWIFYVMFPDLVQNTMLRFRFSDTYSTDTDVVNSIIYTIYSDHSFNSSFFSFPRNCGYAWEPGAFSCFICFAIYANILRTNFSLKFNIVLFTLIVALLTTQSTTGLIIFVMICLLWAIYNRKYLYFLFLIPIVAYVWGMSFVGDKFIGEVSNITTYAKEDVGRLSSFLIYWEDFRQHPIFGGLGDTTSYLFQQGFAKHLYSGFGQMLSYYGLVFTFIFIYCTKKSSLKNDVQYNINTGLILLVVVLGTLVSYNFWDQPVIMCFWLAGIMKSDNQILQYE